MTIDATFWVAVSFFIFFGLLVYLKVPQKVNNSLNNQIDRMKKEINENVRPILTKKLIEDTYRLWTAYNSEEKKM